MITIVFTLICFRANMKVPISLRIAIRVGFIIYSKRKWLEP